MGQCKFMKRACFIWFICFLMYSCKEYIEYGNSELLLNHQLIDFSAVVHSPEEHFKDTLRIQGQIGMFTHDVSINDGNSAIWIESFEPAISYEYVYENLNLHHVEIIGIFDYRKSGAFENYAGKFIKILYIKEIEIAKTKN